MQSHTEAAPPDHFPTETTGLPACRRSEIVELSDSAALDLEIVHRASGARTQRRSRICLEGAA
jgi:hypothetical protein